MSSGNGVAVGQGPSLGSIFFIVGICGILAIGLSCASLTFMMKNAEMLVQMALLFSIVTSVFMGLVGFMSGNLLMGVLGLVAGVAGCCYAFFVWNRIPFVAANLRTALSAVKSNLGLFVLALCMTVVGMGWSVLWFVGLGNALAASSLGTVFVLFLSYYWTHEGEPYLAPCAPTSRFLHGTLPNATSYSVLAAVLRNMVHVTSAVSHGVCSVA